MSTLKSKQLVKQLDELHRTFYDEESILLGSIGDMHDQSDHYGHTSRELTELRKKMSLIKEIIKELEQR